MLDQLYAGQDTRFRARTLSVIGLMLLSFPIVAQQAVEIENMPDLTHRIDEILVDTATPGMIGAIVTRDRVLWAGGVGLANRETMEAADGDTIFRMGSITKSLTSLAILILVERGRLSLDDEVRELLPDLEFVNRWADTDPIRVVHLLEHTSGFDETYRGFRAPEAGILSTREAVELNSRSLVTRWPPGTRVSYSNMGPPVAALIIEVVTGKTYEDFVAEEIFEPLGMESSALYHHDRVAPGHDATGRRAETLLITVRPSGAWVSSARDMARFVRMMLNRGELDGRRILDPAGVERMETPTTGWAAERGVRFGRGLGLNSQYIDGFLFKGIGGLMPGFRALYRYLPEHGVGYFLCINGFSEEAFSRLDELFDALVTANLEPEDPPPIVPLSAEEIQNYEGYYEPDTTQFELLRFSNRILGIEKVTATPDGIVFGSPPIASNSLGDGLFGRPTDPAPSLVFRQDDDETYLINPDGTFRKIPAWSAWGRRTLAVTVVVILLSAPVLALIWIPRRLLGSLKPEDVTLRWIPLGAVLSLFGAFAAFVWTIVTGQPELFARLSIWSVSSTVLTWLFAVLAIAGAWRVAAAWRTAGPRSARVHSALVSAANVTALVYLAYFDIIGLRLWP